MKNFPEGQCSTSFLNGKSSAEVSAFSRGLYYGHGVFETVRIANGEAPLWDLHIKRLIKGSERLGLAVADRKLLEQYRDQCLSLSPAHCVLKIVVMAGSGGRGYAAPPELSTDHLFQSFELPGSSSSGQTGITLWVCQQRLAHAPVLAGMKHLNRLEQILARSEQPVDRYPEGLMLDQGNNVVEAISSNIFCLNNGKWLTPGLGDCGVAGVMREYLISTNPVEEARICLSDLPSMEEVFICNSVKGIQPVVAVENIARWGVGPQTLLWQRQLAREIPCFGH
ncbi:MAG: aminodeoxychorismate lyase [Pseudomonadales bacterium]|nr:aminodeoxychorismate lyase [Pseudomonadales bacterium]MCP5171579.1 aminodeoxychorismate lyase [Pseudomonadales bacterium]